jgi:hypothetical protein
MRPFEFLAKLALFIMPLTMATTTARTAPPIPPSDIPMIAPISIRLLLQPHLQAWHHATLSGFNAKYTADNTGNRCQ